MSGTQTSGGQILGAATAVAGGVAALPATGGSGIGFVLAVGAIACGTLVLSSSAISAFVKKIF